MKRIIPTALNTFGKQRGFNGEDLDKGAIWYEYGRS